MYRPLFNKIIGMLFIRIFIRQPLTLLPGICFHVVLALVNTSLVKEIQCIQLFHGDVKQARRREA